MPRPVRHSLTALLIAWHALLTLGGSGLHALPGMGHGSELNRPSRDDHRHGPGETSRDRTEHCPVCHYLTGEQSRDAAGGGPPAWLASVELPLATESVDLSPAHNPAIPRGPPPRS